MNLFTSMVRAVVPALSTEGKRGGGKEGGKRGRGKEEQVYTIKSKNDWKAKRYQRQERGDANH